MGFQPAELDPEILAGTIFHRASEENQAETFAAIASAFSETREEGTQWTIQDLVGYVNTQNRAAIESLFSNAEITLNNQTFASDKA